MKTFKAAVLVAHNAPLELTELELPRDLYVGQVLIKLTHSGICSAQLGEIKGVKGVDKYMPHLLGHEGSGIVMSTGPGVTHVKLGDAVILHWRKGQGIESGPPKYRTTDGREIGGGWVTSFNEYAVVSENRLTKISPDVNKEHAALLGCAVTTGLGLICNEVQLKIGQSVLVYGCGGVGLNVLQGAKLAGAFPIVGVDLTKEKHEAAIRFGASLACSPAEMASVYSKGKYDVVVDTTGNPDVMKMAWESTANDGVLCLVSQLAHDKYLPLQTLAMHGGKRLIGCDGGGTNPTKDIPRYLRLYEAGRLNLSELVTHRYKLGDINIALDNIRAGKVGRAVIEF